MAITDAVGFDDSETHSGEGVLPFVMLLDVSESMNYDLSTDPISQPGPIVGFNEYLPGFIDMLRSNPSSAHQVHTKIIPFNHEVDTSRPWHLPHDWQYEPFDASGTTALNEACCVAIRVLAEKLISIKEEHGDGVRVLRPTLMVISDGLPQPREDHDEYHEQACRRLERVVNVNKFTVVTVALGQGPHTEYLKALTPNKKNALVLEDANDIEALFQFTSDMIDDVHISSHPAGSEPGSDPGEDISKALSSNTALAPSTGNGDYANTEELLGYLD